MKRKPRTPKIERKPASAKALPEGFFERQQTSERFAEQKRFWMKALQECLAGKSHYGKVCPLVRSVLIKLNKLPFLYTFDSFGDRITKPGYSLEDISLKEARQMQKIGFVPAFISIVLDPVSQH